MILDRINALLKVCDTDERELIEEMMIATGNYVQAVMVNETKTYNIAGRADRDLRDAILQSADSRTTIHNRMMDAVNIVNRRCEIHNVPSVYTGDSCRDRYGDFALELVTEVFEGRR